MPPSRKATSTKKVAKDSPKRAPGPYIVFSKVVRPILEKKYEKSLTFGQYGKVQGILWGSMPDSVKDSINAAHKKGASIEADIKAYVSTIKQNEMDLAKMQAVSQTKK